MYAQIMNSGYFYEIAVSRNVSAYKELAWGWEGPLHALSGSSYKINELTLTIILWEANGYVREDAQVVKKSIQPSLSTGKRELFCGWYNNDKR